MIKKIDKFILVGSSHVAKDSLNEIKTAIENNMPEVVCLELDSVRFKSLMSNNKGKNKSSVRQTIQVMKDIGVFGFLFSSIAGYVQQKIGKNIGAQPGIDMKTGYLKARELKIPVSLIDQNIKVTMKKLSKLSFFKKVSLFSSLIFKSFKKENRELLDFDLKKVPSEKVITQMIGILRKEAPMLYNILIHQRNVYMVNKLFKLKENHEGDILAVVGAGHVDGMMKLIKKRIGSQVLLEDTYVSFSFASE